MLKTKSSPLPIQPQKLKDGSTIPNETFDEDQLEVVTAAERTKFRNDTGGPYPAPMKRRTLLKAIALAPFAPNAFDLVARAVEPPPIRFVRVVATSRTFDKAAGLVTYSVKFLGSADDKDWFEIPSSAAMEHSEQRRLDAMMLSARWRPVELD